MSQRSSFWQHVRNVATYPLGLRGPLAADTTARTLHGLILFLLFLFAVGRLVTNVYPITIQRWAIFLLAEFGWGQRCFYSAVDTSGEPAWCT